MISQITDIPDERPLRAPSDVMRLARMGCAFPTRLSFLRSLTRRLAAEGATVERREWEMDTQGYGHAVYTTSLGGRPYSLVAVTTALSDDMRTDRVIAEAWDSAYVLFDGIPQPEDIARIIANAPLQEAGRFTNKDLVLSRANKSVRLFAHVTEALAAGVQPDIDLIGKTGYLMRTTAVYGNGKFGIADRAAIAGRIGVDGPFQAEMLTVWLIRGFTHDLVEHVAAMRNPGAAKLDRRIKRHLGIGNSTGLGMAPFLVSHPILLHNWMMARETAIARVRAIRYLAPAQIDTLYSLVARVAQHLAEWDVPDIRQKTRIATTRGEWLQVANLMTPEYLTAEYPYDRLIGDTAALSSETQELVIAMMLEPHGDLIDGLADYMSSDREPRLDPAMPLHTLGQLIDTQFDWAMQIDFQSPHSAQQFWYVSEEKSEPRLGDRFAEDGADLEMPLDIARRIQTLAADLRGVSGTVARFLMAHPEHRYIVRRVQTAALHPYSEIHDNLICADCLPIDMLRLKLAFFGASKFDPKSDRWTRITLAQGAPLFDELGSGGDDGWLPTFAL